MQVIIKHSFRTNIGFPDRIIVLGLLAFITIKLLLFLLFLLFLTFSSVMQISRHFLETVTFSVLRNLMQRNGYAGDLLHNSWRGQIGTNRTRNTQIHNHFTNKIVNSYWWHNHCTSEMKVISFVTDKMVLVIVVTSICICICICLYLFILVLLFCI